MDDANNPTQKPDSEPNDADGEPELGAYRRPAPERAAPGSASGTPRQPLGAFPAGPLGTVDATLDLGDHLEVSVNRRLLRIDAGGGLHVSNSRHLPEVLVRSVDLDLGTLDLDLDADGLGGAVGLSVGIAGNALALHTLGLRPSPQRTLVDHWLAPQAEDRSGRRRLLDLSGARTSLWLSPDADLRLRVDRRAVELSLSEALRVVVFGIGFGIAAARYIFAARRIELDREVGLRGLLSAPLLALVAWIASRWLRRQLPSPVGAEGYDPWSDPDRLRHLQEALQALRPGAAPSRETPDEAARGFALPSITTLTATLRADAPGPAIWIAARLPLPGDQAAQDPADDRPQVGLGVRRGSSLRAELRADQVSLRAEGGLFLYADDQPTLQRLRVQEVRFGLASEALEVTTTPPLGALPQATLAQLARDLWRKHRAAIPPFVLELLRDARERPQEPLLWRRELGEGRSITLRAPADLVLHVEHDELGTGLTFEPGVELRFEGLPLPTTTLERLRYRGDDGDVEVGSEPALGPLELAALRHLLRHRLPPRLSPSLQAALSLPPAAEPPSTGVVVGGRTRRVFSATLPELGEVQALLDPADAIVAELTHQGLVVRSAQGLLVRVAGIDLSLDLQGLTLGLDGSLEVRTEPAPGPYVRAALEALLRDNLIPRLRALGVPPAAPEGSWVLHSQEIGDLALEVVLREGDAISLRRDAKGPTLATREWILLHDPNLDTPPVLLRRIRWDAASDALALGTEPEAGALLREVAEHLVRQLGRPALNRLRGLLALPAGPAQPPPTPAPKDTLLLRRPIPALGDLELALGRSYFAMITADAEGELSVAIEGGLRGRVRKLGLQVILEELAYSASTQRLSITSEPALGDLENALIATFARRLLGLLRDHLWPEDAAPGVLAILARSSSQGPATLSLPPGADLRVALDRQMLEIECEAGLLVDLAGASWLPMIHLEKLSYTLADGAIGLRFGGIVERHYREAESVSTVTESILSDLVRVLVSPRFPAAIEPLGFQRVTPPPLLPARNEGIELFSVPLVPGYGAARLTMDPDETILVTASEAEAEVELRCDRGLEVALPALRIRVRVMSARYHIPTGEVQVGGLGQLENAIIESVIRKNLKRPAPGGAPVAELARRLPVDDRGRRQLFANNTVAIRMRSGARFTLALSAAGIEFTASPPLEVDGPAVLNYELRGFTYAFARARFSLILDDDGVLASLFTGVVADAVESQVNKLLRPLLPPSMREPGYSLAADPDSAANLAAVVANFSLLKKGASAEP